MFENVALKTKPVAQERHAFGPAAEHVEHAGWQRAHWRSEVGVGAREEKLPSAQVCTTLHEV